MTSMVLMPVWIISSGYVRSLGLIEAPLMSRKASASTGGLQQTADQAGQMQQAYNLTQT